MAFTAEVLLLGSDELGREFVISAKRLGCHVIACDPCGDNNLWSDGAADAKPELVNVRDEADQARSIAERILENRETGVLLPQQAVLFWAPTTVVRSRSS